MQDRAGVIQTLINNRNYTSYLELGCYQNVTFDKIKCEKKVGVDSRSGGTLRMSTKDFFAQNKETFDIIFIDADHHHDAVAKDFTSSFKVLNSGGAIVMHDCNPCDRHHETIAGCYTVWRAFVKTVRSKPNLDSIVCAFDHGTTIVRVGNNTNLLNIEKSMNELTYDDLNKNRIAWLQPQPANIVVEWIKNWPL